MDFDAAAAENAIIYLKRRQFAFKLRQQIKSERIRWEEKKNQNLFEEFSNSNFIIAYYLLK